MYIVMYSQSTLSLRDFFSLASSSFSHFLPLIPTFYYTVLLGSLYASLGAKFFMFMGMPLMEYTNTVLSLGILGLFLFCFFVAFSGVNSLQFFIFIISFDFYLK